MNLKTLAVTILSALFISSAAFWLALSVGLTMTSATFAAIVIAAPYARLLALSGLRVLLLPAAGLVLGGLAVLIIELLSGGAKISSSYYVFAATLGLCLVALIGSVVFLLLPKLRKRVFNSSQAG